MLIYFLIITNRNESKALLRHIPLDGKHKFNSATCSQFKNGIMINVNMSVRIIVCAKKIIAGIIANLFVKIAIISPYS